ncbi:MAG: PilZ domain-containing protein [Candidatus Omnitrophica bacterium]|nr:PilZ domain-containing protein [Candidatus Omnitrophota bacterium]MDD5670813.1 PilZ domain-containing protein [Candidatus Omnitrophota bacterium]
MEKERRRFKRFDAYMSVKFNAPDDTETKGISLSKDLSRDGLKMNSNKNVKVGTLINLEIDIPDDPKPVRTTAKVIWSRPSEGRNQGYDQGVRFLMMDPVDKFRILDYAYNHWLETKVNDFVDPEQIPEGN